MKVVMFNGLVEAYGTEAEVACFTMMVLDVLKRLKQDEDRESAEREAGIIAEMLKTPIEELMKREQDGGNQ